MARPFAHRFRELPVRRRLILLVCFGALPFAVYLGMEVRSALQQAEHQLHAATAAAAVQVAARLDDRLSDVDNILRALSHTVVPDERLTEENDGRLRALAADLPPFLSNLVLRNRWGDVAAAADPAIRARGFNVADRRFFREALDTGRRSVEAPLVMRQGADPLGIIARPVLVDRQVVGVIAAGIPLSHLATFVADHPGLRGDTRVEVRNAGGVLLASVSGRGNDGDHGVQKTPGESGPGEVVTARATSAFDRWTVTVSTPVSAATAPVHAQLRRHIIVGAIVLLVSLGLAAVVANQIAQGLQQLAGDAHLIGKGATAHRSAILGNDEIGLLGATLNQMADDLAARESRLRRSEDWLRAITDNLPVLIGYVSSGQRYEFINDFGAVLLGRDKADLIGRTVREVRGESAYAQLEAPLKQALRDGLPVTFEQTYGNDARKREVAITFLPDYDDANGVRGAYILGTDLTETRRTELALREREAMFRSIADNLPVLISVVDRNLCYTYCNATYRTWTGVDPERFLGKPVVEVLGQQGLFEDLPHMDKALSGQAVSFERTGEVGGKLRHMLKTFIPRFAIDRPGRVTGFYVLVQDLTARRELEKSLEQMARCDQLTGLPNRYLLHDRLAQACHRSVRDGTQLALFFLDLDGFKPINDTLGHASGDIVLQTLAERLRNAVRMSDTVCRYGGDEFVLLLEGFSSYRQLETMARKLIALVEEPIPVGETEAKCSTSVGIATYPPCKSWEDLLEAADSTMYEAKATGPGHYAIAPLKAAADHCSATTTG